MLAALSELLLIGKAYSIRKNIASRGKGAPNDFWQQLEAALKEAGFDNNEIPALCVSVSRTGLVIPASALSGGMLYMATPWLDELGSLADLEGLSKPVSPNVHF